MLSSVAAAAAVVAIGVFLWNVDGGGPTREDAALLSPADGVTFGQAERNELNDLDDLSEDDVRFALPSETRPDESGAVAKCGKSGKSGKAGKSDSPDKAGEATPGWADLGRAQQGVADVVEVADQGDVDAEIVEALADARDGRGRVGAVHGDAHDLGPGASERRDLGDRRGDVRRVGVGHGLNDDRAAATDGDRADFDADALASLERQGNGHGI